MTRSVKFFNEGARVRFSPEKLLQIYGFFRELPNVRQKIWISLTHEKEEWV